MLCGKRELRRHFCCRCGKCHAAFHARCAGRAAQDAHKAYTCADCAPRLAPKRAAAAGAPAGGGGGKRSKAAKARAAAEQQNLLSIV